MIHLLSFAHLNINGLPSKYSFLLQSVQLHQWDIIILSEAHLLVDFPSYFVDIPGYNLYRNDSLGLFAKHGVCCFVKRT